MVGFLHNFLRLGLNCLQSIGHWSNNMPSLGCSGGLKTKIFSLWLRDTGFAFHRRVLGIISAHSFCIIIFMYHALLRHTLGAFLLCKGYFICHKLFKVAHCRKWVVSSGPKSGKDQLVQDECLKEWMSENLFNSFELRLKQVRNTSLKV